MLRMYKKHAGLLSRLQKPGLRRVSKGLRCARYSISASEEHHSFQSLPTSKKAGKAEDDKFASQVEKLKQWWDSPRFAGLKRPYSAEDVASKQGSLQQTYPSSLMAQKLFALLEEKAEKGLPLHTSKFLLLCYYPYSSLLIGDSYIFKVGAIDPVQMTQQAPYQEALYVSGWACSSVLTTTNEVSPDFGDYPYNTVPNQVQRLFKAQQLHDRKHWDMRRKLTAQQREGRPYIDYLRPIIADGDTG